MALNGTKVISKRTGIIATIKGELEDGMITLVKESDGVAITIGEAVYNRWWTTDLNTPTQNADTTSPTPIQSTQEATREKARKERQIEKTKVEEEKPKAEKVKKAKPEEKVEIVEKKKVEKAPKKEKPVKEVKKPKDEEKKKVVKAEKKPKVGKQDKVVTVNVQKLEEELFAFIKKQKLSITKSAIYTAIEGTGYYPVVIYIQKQKIRLKVRKDDVSAKLATFNKGETPEGKIFFDIKDDASLKVAKDVIVESVK